LDKHLAPIAEAAERHVEASLMNRALLRQSTTGNSPFEARWNALGQVQVYLHYDPKEMSPDIQALQNLGATDIKPSPPLSVIQAWIPAATLNAAANLPGITRVGLPRYAFMRNAPATKPITYTGSKTTEGDQILGAAAFRGATGITGQGIAVGVISDGDLGVSGDQASGDLPANIWNDPNNKCDTAKSTCAEGTAMMEIVYDLAPGVKQLGFCGPNTTVDFLTCLDDFAKDISANVIVDDLGFQGAMFSTDSFTQAIQAFSQAHPNIRLVAATGNDGSGFWQGSWTPAPSSATTVNTVAYANAQNFTPSGTPTPYLLITGSQLNDILDYTVEWNDPWDDSANAPNDPNDYDVVVFDNPNSDSSGGTGHSAVACNQGININPNSGSCTFPNPKQPLNTPGPQPVQGNHWTSKGGTYYLEVLYNGSGTPGQNIKILVQDNSHAAITVTPNTAGSIYGHAALPFPTEISVGAIFAPDALNLGVYNIEPYSSLGPVELGVTDGSTQAIANPQRIPKPDFAAPDCVMVTGAGGFPSQFCGTSAAAPHIAGLVALLMSGYPGQDPYTLLKDAATQPQPGSGSRNDTFGYGVPILTNLLNAGIFPVVTASISAPSDGASVNTGQQISFTGTCAAHGMSGSVTQDWNFGSSGVADSTQANPKVTFKKTGKYTVTLTCTDASGTGTAKISITVSTPSGGGSLGLLDLAILGFVGAFSRRYRKGLSGWVH
jgi:hypothetical protein